MLMDYHREAAVLDLHDTPQFQCELIDWNSFVSLNLGGIYLLKAFLSPVHNEERKSLDLQVDGQMKPALSPGKHIQVL